MVRLTLFAALLFSFAASPANGQNQDYFRTFAGGDFRTAVFWSPFIQPFFGPGGATDRVHFDLNHSFVDLYTIGNVNGINEALIIGNDSVRLEITDYELVDCIEVGVSPGDIGIAVLSGIAGSTLTSPNVCLGSTGARGSVIVDGQGLLWNLEDGGLVIAAGNLVVLSGTVNGDYAFAYDNFSGIEVVGNDSTLNLECEIAIGGDIPCFLMVEDGGQVETSYAIADEDSNIVVKGDGSVLTVADELYLGNGSILDVVDGGIVVGTNGHLIDDGSTANIEGLGSTWTMFGSLEVGADVGAALNVSDGSTVFASNAILGDHGSDLGTISVDGIGSLFCSPDLAIGIEGDGVLNVLDGGRVETNFAIAGDLPGSTGEINVIGAGSVWSNATNVTIAGLGNGAMSIEQGGRVNSATGSIAENSFGIVSVADSSSIWQLEGVLEVGFGANGFLTISDGGSVTSFGTSTVGHNSFSSGLATVNGAGSSWVNEGTIRVGFLGQGTLDIQNDGLISCIECLIGEDGLVFLGGGTLAATTLNFDGGSFIFNSGTLRVGTCNQSISNQGGTLAPGPVDNVGGTTQINGLYLPQQDAVLDIEIGGVNQGVDHDFVQSVGDTFLNGELHVQLIDGFIPSAQQEFTVYNVSSGDLFDSFNNVVDGARLETVGGEGSFRVDYGFGNLHPKQIILSDFQAQFVLGDVNGDGVVNLLDVGPFIDLISSGNYNPAADINMDGVVNLLDVGPFVDLLAG